MSWKRTRGMMVAHAGSVAYGVPSCAPDSAEPAGPGRCSWWMGLGSETGWETDWGSRPNKHMDSGAQARREAGSWVPRSPGSGAGRRGTCTSWARPRGQAVWSQGSEMKRGLLENQVQGRSYTFPSRDLLKALRSQAMEEENGRDLMERRPAWGLTRNNPGL